ncbi:MAG: sulfotransferase family 2 domain-containing protein, partial [Pseudomonadota bacterium]
MTVAAALFDQPPPLTQYICHWSVRHGFVYVETPKVACTTVKRVLQAAELGPERQTETPADVHAKSQSPLLAPSSDLQGFVAAMRDPAVFRFGFVRNPYARALSCWLDKMVNNDFERRRLAPQLGL